MKNQRNTIQVVFTGSEYGELLNRYSAPDIEESILGNLILTNENHSLILGQLDNECFSINTNLAIYKAIKQLALNDKPINILTITNELRQTAQLDAIGGPYRLVELTAKAANDNQLQYALILNELAIKRQVINDCASLLIESKEPDTDVFELFNSIEKRVQDVFNRISSSQEINSNQFLKAVEEYLDKEQEPTIRTNHIAYDSLLGDGPVLGSLNIIAAPNGAGKTSFLIDIIMQGLKVHPIALASLEINKEQVYYQMLKNWSFVDLPTYFQNRNPNVKSEAKLFNEYFKNELKAFKIMEPLDGNMKLSTDKVELVLNWVRKQAKEGIKIIAIDYLQMIVSGGDSAIKSDAIGQFCYGLKFIANYYNCIILLLSQVTRESTKKGIGRPSRDDMSESKKIGDAADTITCIYRPVNEGIAFWPEGSHPEYVGQSTQGMAEIYTVKNRHYKNQSLMVYANMERKKFDSIKELNTLNYLTQAPF